MMLGDVRLSPCKVGIFKSLHRYMYRYRAGDCERERERERERGTQVKEGSRKGTVSQSVSPMIELKERRGEERMMSLERGGREGEPHSFKFQLLSFFLQG
ncbi:hypothetical protein KC19_4G004500 [Ceratodon purpureus]|uniref:Uncharacterized protein n=1 Tax=Ceratodon purpureus TaxID=3225 RepID=A0A8T0I3W3_CERPU|nr:hypothetical protein KC19_4G004500 [Ceratodon purpureus]